MKTILFNQKEDMKFEVLNENEMHQVKGGFIPKEKDILDPDEE